MKEISGDKTEIGERWYEQTTKIAGAKEWRCLRSVEGGSAGCGRHMHVRSRDGA